MADSPTPRRGSRGFLVLLVVGLAEVALEISLIARSPTNGFFYVAATIGLALALVGFFNYWMNKLW